MYTIASQVIEKNIDDDTLCEVCKLVAQDLEQILDEDSTEVYTKFCIEYFAKSLLFESIKPINNLIYIRWGF